jgi:hypothetical protein
VKSKEKKQGREFLEGGLRRGEVGESVSVSLPFSISDNTWGRHHLVIPLRSPTADGHFVIRAEKTKGYLTLVSSVCVQHMERRPQAGIRSDDTTLCLLSCHVIFVGGRCWLGSAPPSRPRLIVHRRLLYELFHFRRL